MELREVFEPIVNFLKSLQKKEKEATSKDKAKERLQLVLMQDRASVSPDFFEMMKKEIIEVIKKYIEIDEEALEVQLTRGFEDGDDSGPALYANIPIKNIKPVAKKVEETEDDLVTETISHENMIGEAIESVTHKEEVTQGKENVEEVSESIVKQNEKKAEEGLNSATTEVATEIGYTQTEDNEKIEIEENVDAVKDKINEVKDGVTETIQKVKKGAKEGIKKIKTKAQKKKIKE